jgi:nucleoside-diphosphate-sugar epimerase
MSRVMITGAAGFLGRALVRRARVEGIEVLALTRGVGDPAWARDTGITQQSLDLGNSDSVAALASLMAGTEAVIHAAASFSGDAATHARDTLGATGHLLQAISAMSSAPRLVLVSSLSVYDVAAMADHAVLDEAGPLLHDAAQRDAYAAAKAEQERLVRASGVTARILRPGAIYGPGRLWSAQLGFAKAGVVVCPGGDAAMPAIHVDHAAAALIRAAGDGQGRDVVNLIDPGPPSQMDWLVALDRRVIRVPRALVLAAGRRLGRGPSWQARFRPLRYDTTQAQALLDHLPQGSFATAIAEARQREQDLS